MRRGDGGQAMIGALVLVLMATALVWLGLGVGSIGWQSPWQAWSDDGLRQLVW